MERDQQEVPPRGTDQVVEAHARRGLHDALLVIGRDVELAGVLVDQAEAHERPQPIGVSFGQRAFSNRVDREQLVASLLDPAQSHLRHRERDPGIDPLGVAFREELRSDFEHLLLEPVGPREVALCLQRHGKLSARELEIRVVVLENPGTNREHALLDLASRRDVPELLADIREVELAEQAIGMRLLELVAEHGDDGLVDVARLGQAPELDVGRREIPTHPREVEMVRREHARAHLDGLLEKRERSPQVALLPQGDRLVHPSRLQRGMIVGERLLIDLERLRLQVTGGVELAERLQRRRQVHASRLQVPAVRRLGPLEDAKRLFLELARAAQITERLDRQREVEACRLERRVIGWQRALANLEDALLDLARGLHIARGPERRGEPVPGLEQVGVVLGADRLEPRDHLLLEPARPSQVAHRLHDRRELHHRLDRVVVRRRVRRVLEVEEALVGARCRRQIVQIAARKREAHRGGGERVTLERIGDREDRLELLGGDASSGISIALVHLLLGDPQARVRPAPRRVRLRTLGRLDDDDRRARLGLEPARREPDRERGSAHHGKANERILAAGGVVVLLEHLARLGLDANIKIGVGILGLRVQEHHARGVGDVLHVARRTDIPHPGVRRAQRDLERGIGTELGRGPRHFGSFEERHPEDRHGQHRHRPPIPSEARRRIAPWRLAQPIREGHGGARLIRCVAAAVTISLRFLHSPVP